MNPRKPYVPMCRRTPQSPERWQTERWTGKQYEAAPAADMQAAIYACQACPLLAACSTQPPVENSIHAGVIYDHKARPFTSVAAFKRRKLHNPAAVCGDHRGTPYGYQLHRKHEEKPCEDCREARNAQKRAGKASQCNNGHKYTPETTRFNSRGHRFCGVCRPERPQVTTQHTLQTRTSCQRNHDWTDPNNVLVSTKGIRYCAECKRQRARDKHREMQEFLRAERSEMASSAAGAA